MDSSIFMDKTRPPTTPELKSAIGETYTLWENIRKHVLEMYPKAIEEWNYPGTKYGWSFRMKDKKRAIIYFLPRDSFFMVALVFSAKATQQALSGKISTQLKSIIDEAPVYAEGRGFRISIKDENILSDIKELIGIKLAN